MRDDAPEVTALEFVECINTGDLDGIVALTASTYTFIDMEGDVYVAETAEAIRESWNEYLSANPDYRIIVQQVLRSGDGVAIVGQTIGSHLDPDVERKELVLWTAKLVDGCISEWRIYSTLVCVDA